MGRPLPHVRGYSKIHAVVSRLSTSSGKPLAFDPKVLVDEVGAHAVAQITLKLNPVVDDGAASAAQPFQLGAQLLQELVVSREVEQDGDDLAATALFLDAKFGNRTRGDVLRGRGLVAAPTLARRPSAP
jgi:hypothetical protein